MDALYYLDRQPMNNSEMLTAKRLILIEGFQPKQFDFPVVVKKLRGTDSIINIHQSFQIIDCPSASDFEVRHTDRLHYLIASNIVYNPKPVVVVFNAIWYYKKLLETCPNEPHEGGLIGLLYPLFAYRRLYSNFRDVSIYVSPDAEWCDDIMHLVTMMTSNVYKITEHIYTETEKAIVRILKGQEPLFEYKIDEDEIRLFWETVGILWEDFLFGTQPKGLKMAFVDIHNYSFDKDNNIWYLETFGYFKRLKAPPPLLLSGTKTIHGVGRL